MTPLRNSAAARTRRLVTAALLAAMALAAQWLESLLPPLLPMVPVKLGLANLFTLYALLAGADARAGRVDALAVSLLRVLLYPLVTGAMSGFLYSLVGALLAYLGMSALLPLYFCGRVGAAGVSVLGAYLFNMGQWLVGYLAVGRAMLAYLPWMGLLSIPAGLVTGLLAALILRRLPGSVRP